MGCAFISPLAALDGTTYCLTYHDINKQTDGYLVSYQYNYDVSDGRGVSINCSSLKMHNYIMYNYKLSKLLYSKSLFVIRGHD